MRNSSPLEGVSIGVKSQLKDPVSALQAHVFVLVLILVQGGHLLLLPTLMAERYRNSSGFSMDVNLLCASPFPAPSQGRYHSPAAVARNQDPGRGSASSQVKTRH